MREKEYQICIRGETKVIIKEEDLTKFLIFDDLKCWIKNKKSYHRENFLKIFLTALVFV